MLQLSDKLIAARKASDLTLENAAKLANLSKQGYINREKNPEQFRLCELAGVYQEISDTAKPIFREGVMEIFLSE